MKNLIKVLPIWFKNQQYKKLIIRDLNKYNIRITPKFNKAGWYYNRHEKISWLELDGKAWLDDRTNDFKYNLELLDHKPLLNKEKKALVVLQLSKITSKKQNRLLYIDNAVLELRRILISGKLFRKRIMDGKEKS